MDLLNVIACFAVVVLHCTTVVFLNQGDKTWTASVILQCLCIFAVPVFFMISGANLLGYRQRYDTKTFFKKRFRRVVFTLVAASVVVYLATPAMHIALGFTPPYMPSFSNFVYGFFHNEICSVYWFFYAILILYLVTPIFSLIVDNKRVLEYALMLCIASSMVIPLIERYSPDSTFLELFTIPYLGSWLTYYLLGYYLVRHNKLERVSSWKICLLAAITMLMMIILTFRTNLPHTVASGAFLDYDSFYANAGNLLALIYASSLFILASRRNDAVENSRLYPVIRKLSGLSLGVYAIHILVIDFLDMFIAHRLLWDVGIRPFAVFAISLLLTFAGKQLMAVFRSLKTR